MLEISRVPHLVDGAPDSRGTVVVGRDREGPASRHLAVELKQAAGGPGGEEGVESFVRDMVDAEKTTTGGARELPKSRGAYARVHLGVVGGFHVRQRHKVLWDPHVAERLTDERQPATRTDQTLTEAVGLACLEPDMGGGGT